jgi:hypothetical protein
MKNLLLPLLLLLSTTTASAQLNPCAGFRTGVFQFPGIEGGVYTVIRTDSTQTERHSRQPGYSVMKIRWNSNCTYTLYDRVEYTPGKAPKPETEILAMHNVIYKFEQPGHYYVHTFVPGYPDTISTAFTKLDLGKKWYNNLFQLPEFAEYKDSKAYGQTLLGDIHSIDYYESTKTPGLYLLTFETSYHGAALNYSTLLDSVSMQLKEGQNIARSNCRYQGKFDEEIIAVYHSRNEKKEARILKAFRCNRASGKIEAVATRDVRYKETHKIRLTL